MELLMLSPKSANLNLTKFLWSALPEKEGLGQPITACLLSRSLQDFPLLHNEESYPALTNQQMLRIASLSAHCGLYQSLPQAALRSSLLCQTGCCLIHEHLNKSLLANCLCEIFNNTSLTFCFIEYYTQHRILHSTIAGQMYNIHQDRKNMCWDTKQVLVNFK